MCSKWNAAAGLPTRFPDWESDAHVWLRQADAAIAAYEAALAEKGMLIVPREATERMARDGGDLLLCGAP